jgi:hypothetical protein
VKCGRPPFLSPLTSADAGLRAEEGPRPPLPDKLTDCLTGKEIPFSNRDNIRQKILVFLLKEKGYKKEDFSLDREIRFDLDGQTVISLVDISIILGERTVMVWKCASGSLVSRERQIIASSRLLEDYVVPLAAVTNGSELELLDSLTEKVIGSGFGSLPSREILTTEVETLSFRPVKGRKIVNERRILYTYDAISCPVACRTPAGD